jgi:hypothetical protein
LALAWTLVLIAGLQAGYRLSRPTDGWVITDTGDFAKSIPLFTANLLDEPSPIQSGDQLLAVNGVPMPTDLARDGLLPPPLEAQFQPGATLTYTVRRGEQMLELAVPLKRWSLAAVLAYRFRDIGSTLSFAISWLLVLLGSLVVVRRPAEPAARALLLFATASLCNILSLTPEDAGTFYSAVAPLAIFFGYLIWATLLAPSLLALTLTFPRPKPFVRRAPWLLLVPYLLYWLFLAALGPGVIASAGFGLSAFYFITALIATLHAVFTERDQLGRTQLRWAFGGLLALLVGALPLFSGVLLTLAGFPSLAQAEWVEQILGVTMPLGAAAFQVMIAIAILRYRLFDIDVIIRRTLQYSLLSGLLALTYFGLVIVLQTLTAAVGGQRTEFITVLSTLAIAALFFPLRRRVQQFIDRRFYRQKYDAQKVLAEFGAHAREETDLAALTGKLADAARDALQPDNVSVWLKR